MIKTKITITLLLFSILLIVACTNEEEFTINDLNDNNKPSTTNKNSGGEELLGIRAEYSFCYDTGAYNPTERSKCEMQLTFKECSEWMMKQEGEGSTIFYANFTGGEPTKTGRTANEYYMVVTYADNKVEQTDTRTVFKEKPSEFMHFVRGNCYPNATIEIYNLEDELMGTETFDYAHK
ncbi:MAG: hypothetical protein ACLFN8_02225 [Candidatus Woesearchaeota archaeon]